MEQIEPMGQLVDQVSINSDLFTLLSEFVVSHKVLKTERIYHSDKKKYSIHYLQQILNDNGRLHETPARIHSTENFIEVGKDNLAKYDLNNTDIIYIILSTFCLSLTDGDHSKADVIAYQAMNRVGFEITKKNIYNTLAKLDLSSKKRSEKFRNKRPSFIASADSIIIQLGQYQLDVTTQKLMIDDKIVKLTSKECELLFYLYKSSGSVIEQSRILMDVWGDDDYATSRSMDVFVSRLRKLLSDDSNVSIIKLRKGGYKFIY